MGDINQYLKSVKKEAFDANDPNVVLIAPNRATKESYSNLYLPCEREAVSQKLIADEHLDGEDEYTGMASTLKQA